MSQPDTMLILGYSYCFANNRNRVHGAVLDLSRVGACTDLFQNLSVNSLKGDLSNTTTFKPPLFSLVNTFNAKILMNNFSCFKSTGIPYVINLFRNMFFLIRNNMRMNDNVLEASHKHKVKKVGVMLRVFETGYSKDFQN